MAPVATAKPRFFSGLGVPRGLTCLIRTSIMHLGVHRTVTFDEQLADLTDRALASLRGQVETDVRELVRRVVEAGAEEQRLAVARAREQVANELRRASTVELEAVTRQGRERLDMAHRQFEQQLADVWRHADAQVEAAREEGRQYADAARPAGITQADHERAIASAVAQAQLDVREGERSAALRLLDAVRSLDGCAQMTAVLDVLLEAVAGELPAVALLVVSGDRLRGVGFRGFPLVDSPDVEIAIADAGLVGAAVASGTPLERAFPAAPGDLQPPAFARGGAGACVAMATPMLVGGEVVAVLYAEAPCTDSSAAANRWPAFVELIVRHGGRCLEALMASRVIGAATA